MTGIKLYNLALSFMDEESETAANVPESVLNAVNQVSSELLCLPPVKDITEDIPVPQNAIYTFGYGLAAIISGINTDAERYNLFSSLYQKRRNALKCESTTVSDVLPKAVT